MIALLALILELVGVAFLVVATIGVLRFEDPFQRMHAATKAGTLGAGLVLVGTALSHGGLDTTVIALLTIVFLIATMPVAGHLLGRASYISGAPLRSREDALEGVLPRKELPLEERELRQLGVPADDRPSPARREGLHADDRSSNAGYDAVRFAVIAPDASRVARRAKALAAAQNVPLIGVAVIDEGYLDSPDADDRREAIRARLAEAVAETRTVTAHGHVPLSLSYEEGDPLALIPGRARDRREILILPTQGWCHHGALATLDVDREREADKLFALAQRHNGPTLFVGTATEGEPQGIVIHDGSPRIQNLAVWAIKTGLWPIETLIVAGPARPDQVQALLATAREAGIGIAPLPRPKAPPGALLPAHHARVTAVILADLAQTAPPDAAGPFWQDCLIPGFRGDVLVG